MPILWNSDSIRDTYSISFSYINYPRYAEEVKPFIPSHLTVLPVSRGTYSSVRKKNRAHEFTKRFKIREPVIKFLKFSLYYPLFAAEVIRLLKVLRKVRPSVLHLNNGGYPGAHSVRAAALAGRLIGCKEIVMTVNNIAYPYATLWRYLDYPLDFAVKRCVTRFTTASYEAQQALASILHLDSSQVSRIPNAVAYPLTVRPSVSTRSSLGTPPNATVIGIVALLEERKGHEVFLESLASIIRNDPELERETCVWFVGDGPLNLELRSRVDSLGLASIVKFLGYRNDHLELLGAMDIVVLPSLRLEDSPLATIEAMAFSKPVIASRVSGLTEQIEDGVSGYLVEPGNTIELGQRITHLLKDRESRLSYGIAGYNRYEQNFSPEHFTKRYLELYQQLSSSS